MMMNAGELEARFFQQSSSLGILHIHKLPTHFL